MLNTVLTREIRYFSWFLKSFVSHFPANNKNQNCVTYGLENYLVENLDKNVQQNIIFSIQNIHAL